jgi:signal-transduction protein with cAMP-binding, CBS, and nucleotidyltransferase domain
MFTERVRSVMERKKLLIASPETTVVGAAKLMAKRKVGAVMVVDDDRKLIGMFTERDVIMRVIAEGRDVQTTQLGEVMTTLPQSVDPDKSFGYALLLMHENGFRHVPVVEHGKVIGIVSARDALDPKMEELLVESERRKKILRERA